MKTIEESRWYLEGVKAEKEGLAIATNPYTDGTPKWYIWNAGWFPCVQHMGNSSEH